MDTIVNNIKDFSTDHNIQVALAIIALFTILTIALFIELFIRASFSSVIIFLVLVGYFAFSLWMIFPLEKQYIDFMHDTYAPLFRLH
jgi:glucan phosphoethanolaminetransferase (alkaline phosphatase superfamily)